MLEPSGHRDLGVGGGLPSLDYLRRGKPSPACPTHTLACPLKTSKECDLYSRQPKAHHMLWVLPLASECS